MDGDFHHERRGSAPVLQVLRKAGVHIVALHSHMIGEHPSFISPLLEHRKARSAHAFRAALTHRPPSRNPDLPALAHHDRHSRR